jgi:hypothetical protein
VRCSTGDRQVQAPAPRLLFFTIAGGLLQAGTARDEAALALGRLPVVERADLKTLAVRGAAHRDEPFRGASCAVAVELVPARVAIGPPRPNLGGNPFNLNDHRSVST